MKLKWTEEEITAALKEAQYGDQFVELGVITANRFRRIGREHGLNVRITGTRPAFTATVEGTAK